MSDYGSPTWYFNLHWSNDEPLYWAVLGHAEERLARSPKMTREALGAYVISTVERWCEGLGVDLEPPLIFGRVAHHSQSRPAGVDRRVLAMMGEEVGDFRLVDEAEVGDAVLEGLSVEESEA